MKKILLPLLLVANAVSAQFWQAEVQAGLSGYSGDLNIKAVSPHNIGPGVAVNAAYYFNSMVALRAGLGWGQFGGNDKYNEKSPLLFARNLNFKTNVLELTVCGELNVLEPEVYYTYPYLFAGVGIFHFNPYTTDKNGEKVYLRPLGTEGQGIPEAGNKKMYSLFQLCIPFGAGAKMRINEQWEAGFELGFRKTFTDYIDDVSTRYANPEILLATRGAQAFELAYRGPSANLPKGGEIRGNSKKKDLYYFAGLKLIWKFNHGDTGY